MNKRKPSYMRDRSQHASQSRDQSRDQGRDHEYDPACPGFYPGHEEYDNRSRNYPRPRSKNELKI